jgi:hypothetical protein
MLKYTLNVQGSAVEWFWKNAADSARFAEGRKAVLKMVWFVVVTAFRSIGQEH